MRQATELPTNQPASQRVFARSDVIDIANIFVNSNVNVYVCQSQNGNWLSAQVGCSKKLAVRETTFICTILFGRFAKRGCFSAETNENTNFLKLQAETPIVLCSQKYFLRKFTARLIRNMHLWNTKQNKKGLAKATTGICRHKFY